jgi:hypothetical protein
MRCLAFRAWVLGLYCRSAGPLHDGQLGDLLVLADMATMLLLDSIGGGAAADGHVDGAWLDGQSPDLAMHRAEIDQATGMLTVQLGSLPRRLLSGCGRTLTVRTGGSPTWPATSSPGGCGCGRTWTRTRTRCRAAPCDAQDSAPSLSTGSHEIASATGERVT